MKRILTVALTALLTLTTPACASADSFFEPMSADGAVFSDVQDSAWYADAVVYVHERGLMNGTGENRFSPDDTFTRAQFATVLYRLAGEPGVTGTDGFIDTEADTWYSDAVTWSAQQGIFQGYNGRFSPSDPVTQEQLVTPLWRYTEEPQAPAIEITDDASSYALDAIRWARGSGVIDESKGYVFAARQATPRYLVAVLLADFCRKAEEREAEENGMIELKINDTAVSVVWEDNESVTALRELLTENPLTIQMSMYGGFEQVGALGTSLPRNDVQTTTSAGDIVLYSGSNIVVFYGSNTWAYTRLGKIENQSVQGLRTLLGSGDVTVTLSVK